MRFSSLCFLLLAMAVNVCRADFQLLSNFTFNNSYSDTLGNSANLVPIGAVTLGAGTLAFDRGEGLSLTTGITLQDYAIEMDVQFTDLDNWNKLIDFQNRSVDAGLYLNPANSFIFFGVGNASAEVVNTGTPYTLRLERLGDQLNGYINGTLVFSNIDSTSLAVSTTNQLNFFLDDTIQDSEFSAGTVSGLRLYAVPEPSSSLLACLAATSVVGTRRLRRFIAK